MIGFRSPRKWTLAQRLDHYTDKSGGSDACWPWIGQVDKIGYGRLRPPGGKTHRLAHRLAWQVENGEIPAGQDVLHRCDNPSCVNPRHLRPGTHQENMADRDARGRGRFPDLRGERSGSAKLTEEQVRAIIAASAVPGNALAVQYGVSPATISMVRSGKRWAHLSPEMVR